MSSNTYVLVQSGLLVIEGLLFVALWHFVAWVENKPEGVQAAVLVAISATGVNSFALSIFFWHNELPYSELGSLIMATFFATCMAWVLRDLWLLALDSFAVVRKGR